MMGKNNGNSWLNAVKKAFISPSKDNEKRNNKRREQNEPQQEEKKRGKRKWIFGKHFPIETTIQHKVAKTAISLCTGRQENMVSKQPKLENHSLSEQKRAIALAMATTTAAEAAVANAVEIIRLSKTSILVKEHEAAVVIQTNFRGYLSRRALLALKGVVKMQALIRGHNVRKRAKMTLQCIQSLVRVQALVCDQRRMSMSKNAPNTSINLDLEEIQKAKQCSLKQGNTLAHILTHQTWTLNGDQNSDNNYPDRKVTNHPTVRKDRNLCVDQRDPIKTVDIDTFTPPKSSFIRSQNKDSYFIPSPKTQSTKSYQTAEISTPRPIYLHQMSLSENSCPLPRPNYMADTQSAMARVRPHSSPRQRPSSPSRQQMGSAKKRLSFPIPDEQKSNGPYYLTE